LNPIIKYETTKNKIKICEKLLERIKHGYLKVNFIHKINIKIFKFNYHWHLNYKKIMNLFFLNSGSKLVYIIKVYFFMLKKIKV